MQSSSHELNIPVADSVYVENIYVKIPFAYAENDNKMSDWREVSRISI